MIQINPDEILPIIRQLADPTDSNTYYVRAFIRKHKGSGESLIATVNLTDKTGQRFTYFYQTPGDSDPYHLSVITKVYTDSGYTTLSPRYTMDAIDYLVSERWGLMYGHGGGVEVDYNKIQKMIRKEVGGIPKPEKPGKIDLREVLTAISQADDRVKNIVIPEQAKTNLQPLLELIQKVKDAVRDIPQPAEPEKLDITPALREIKNTEEIIKQQIIDLVKLVEDNNQKGFQDMSDILQKNQRNKNSMGAIKKILSEEPEEEQLKPIKKRKWL